MQQQQNNLVGTILGQYQIVELIGEGGMSSVYKAWQPSLRRYVALKVLAPHLTRDAEFVQRFHQEAVSAANLKHTNIVTIHDVGTESGWYYIAMEFIEGTSLEEYIRSGSLTLEQVADIVSQIGAALDYAHKRGFIHRDIKPGNILIEASGRAVLTDFGIVKALSGSGVTSAITRSGDIFGTPHYMSPEQIRDEPLDHRSDLYSLGIVCYEMLSGNVPFDGTTTYAVIQAQTNDPPPPLHRTVGPAVPQPVEAVVNKILAKNRTDRYDSAGEFARDLAQAIAGVWPDGIRDRMQVPGHQGTGTTMMDGMSTGIPATPSPISAPARRKRWPLVVGTGAVGVVLVMAAVAALLLTLGPWIPLRRAQAALDAGEYVEAVEQYDLALVRDADNIKAIDGIIEAADYLVQSEQFDDAIAAYDAAWQARPEEERALRGLGRAYEAKEEWNKAAGWYERWTQTATQDENAFLALGNARFNLGEYERAVEAYEQADALGAAPTEVDAHLGLAYFELDQHGKAVERLQNAVSQTPDDFLLQRALGLALYDQGQHEQAVGHLEKAVDLGADRSGDELVDVYYALGSCYFEKQDYEQSINSYHHAREIDSEGESVWAGQAQADLDEAYTQLAQQVMKEAALDLDFADIASEGDETYAIARTGQRISIEGAVHLVDGPWNGSQALVVEEGTENLCTNPSFETRTTGWYVSGENAPRITRDTAEHHRGSASLKVTTVAHGAKWWDAVVLNRNNRYTFKKNISYTVSFWAKASEAVSGVYVGLKMDHAPWTSYGSNVDIGTEWQRYQITVTWESADDNDARHPEFGFGLLKAGIDIWLDQVQVEEKPHATSYCDGSLGTGYSWTGWAHASLSQRLPTRASIAAANNIDLDSGSISAWANFDNKLEEWDQALFGIGIDGNNRFFLTHWSSSSLYVRYQTESGDAYINKNTGVPAGGWHHVVVTWDTNDRLYFYFDGVPVGSQAMPGESVTGTTLYIGGYIDGSLYWNSPIAEFVVFDHILTPAEASALYNAGASTSK